MPAMDNIQAAIDILEASRGLEDIYQQKDSVINAFNEKYMKLDAAVKALEIKKAEIERCALSVADANAEALVIVKKAKDQATEVVNAAMAEAKEIIEKARLEAGTFMFDAVQKTESAKIAEKSASEKMEVANSKEADAARLLREASVVKAKADECMAEANKAAQEASAALSEASGKVIDLDNQLEAIKTDRNALEDRISLLKEKEAAVDVLRISAMDAQSKLNDDTLKFNEFVVTKSGELNSKKVIADELREALIKQKEQNSFKSAELDAGFAKLKREQEELKKQKTVIDGMKKELSNKGA